VLGSRIYVVTSAALAAEVQKRRTLLFDPLVPDLTGRVLGMDAATKALLETNADRAQGNWGPVPEMHDTNAAAMAAGPQLDALVAAAVDDLFAELNARGARMPPEAGGDVGLLAWTKDAYTTATARYLYGAANPLAADPSLADAFWAFDHGLGGLLLGVAPSLTAGPAYRGRERLVRAFAAHVAGPEAKLDEVAPIIRRRVEVLRRNGLSADAQARTEVSFLFAAIVNTAISSFWLVHRLSADAALLAAARAEMRAALGLASDASDDGDELAVDPAVLRGQGCPLLQSAFREALRCASDVSSTRLVTADTVLTPRDGSGGGDDAAGGGGRRFALRAGSVVQISGAALHADPRVWGADDASFDPQRFLRGLNTVAAGPASAEDAAGGSGGAREGKKGAATRAVHPAAFRAFGGGATLCPGRHLAAAEVLAWTAGVLLAYDVERVDDGDVDKEDGVLPVHVCEPRRDVRVRLRWRGKRVVIKGAEAS
jgi:cytochrome P450